WWEEAIISYSTISSNLSNSKENERAERYFSRGSSWSDRSVLARFTTGAHEESASTQGLNPEFFNRLELGMLCQVSILPTLGPNRMGHLCGSNLVLSHPHGGIRELGLPP